MELSHRSSAFTKIITKAENDLREIMQIPSNYKVLFLQGGANGQFSAVPLNLMNLKPNKSADYIVTGYWSEKAADEAGKYGHVNLVLPKTKTYTTIPSHEKWNLDPEASYVYYCDNETIHGVEFDTIPVVKNNVPIVVDCSSNFLSKPLDISKFGCIFACAQKNMGPAGVTVVIIRDDLIGHQMSICPSIFDYKILADNNSLYQTPPTYSIYLCGLVFEWMKKIGGIEVIGMANEKKASLIYDLIDNSNGFYFSPVEKIYRSKVNVPFRIKKNNIFDEKLEQKFLADAEKNYKMKELKGHRSVGGIRASIYNSVSLKDIEVLVNFMKEFLNENKY